MLDKKKVDYLKNFSDDELIEYLVVVRNKETELNSVVKETIQESDLSPDEVKKLKIAEAFAQGNKPSDSELELVEKALKPIKKMTQANKPKPSNQVYGWMKDINKVSEDEKVARSSTVETVKKILNR